MTAEKKAPKKRDTYVAGVPLEPSLLKRVDREATADQRSRAGMMRVLIIEALGRRDEQRAQQQQAA